MEPILVLCTVISLIIALWVGYRPLISSNENKYYNQEEQKAHRFDPKVALLEAIAELEQDCKLGHLSKEEFERLSLEYKREYLNAKKASPES